MCAASPKSTKVLRLQNKARSRTLSFCKHRRVKCASIKLTAFCWVGMDSLVKHIWRNLFITFLYSALTFVLHVFLSKGTRDSKGNDGCGMVKTCLLSCFVFFPQCSCRYCAVSHDGKLICFKWSFTFQALWPPLIDLFFIAVQVVWFQRFDQTDRWFFVYLLSFRAEDVHAPEQRRADQERSTEGDLRKRWAYVTNTHTHVETDAALRREREEKGSLGWCSKFEGVQ